MGIFSSIGNAIFGSDDGLTPVTVEQEVADLFREFDTPVEGEDDMGAQSRRFAAAMKLEYKHGIVQGGDGEFYFPDSEEDEE